MAQQRCFFIDFFDKNDYYFVDLAEQGTVSYSPSTLLTSFPSHETRNVDAEPRTAAAHSGTSSPSQPPSSTDPVDANVVPVREMLSPLGAQRLNTEDRELAGRQALVSYWPRGLQSVPRDALGLRFNQALMGHNQSLMDLGTSVLSIERAGFDWRDLEQELGESPVKFILRVIRIGAEIREARIH